MIFYDYEVFKEDWLVVIKDTATQSETVIVNDSDKLKKFNEVHEDDLWVGYNNNHYDQWIHKSILCDLDPYETSKAIIEQNIPGWKISNLFRRIKMFNYDVMIRGDGGLKSLEGFMGSNIKESDVDFKIQRKLTQDEIDETIKYCRHDVEETMEVFLHRKSDFEAQMALAKLPHDHLELKYLSKTKAQMAAIVLEAQKQNYSDEFDLQFPDNLEINRYTEVLEFYRNPDNRNYSQKLTTMVAGVPHVYGWGGVHGAKEKYIGDGYFINMDVTSLYPSLMIQYGLLSRSIKDPRKFKEIYDTRVKYKHEGNPLQAPLKIVINSTYGAMKDVSNPLYDPRQANLVCLYGQLFLTDLMEKLEPVCEIIQSNTDGVLVKLRNEDDFDLIDDIAWDWEQRTHLSLEFSEFKRVYQKDVNNYVMVGTDGHVKTKGAWLKKLNPLDNDLPIINEALKRFLVDKVPPQQTINNCDDLEQFQQVCKISSKYKTLVHNGEVLNERCVRAYASLDADDGGLFKQKYSTNRLEKFANSPKNCFIYNGKVKGAKTPRKLDRQYYIDMVNDRIKAFGMIPPGEWYQGDLWEHTGGLMM